ncbi:MAG: hypothetical protein HY777_06415 [Betaproteobacteria bacterium]|nr:hypothetical protein [Betaproteobacteria bacterium]
MLIAWLPALAFVYGELLYAEDGTPEKLPIASQLKLMRKLPAITAEQRIYTVFKDSPKLSRVIRDELAVRGYRIVDTEADADIVLKFLGSFTIDGAGKEKL